jgi:hypothetical protein
MRSTIPIFVSLIGLLAVSRPLVAADAEGCADVKLLPRLEGCVIQECSAKQHDSFDTAGVDVVPGTPGPLDANTNSLTYSCPATMNLQRVRQELDAEIHKAGFLNVAEDKADPANSVTTTRKGSHWIRWGTSSDGGIAYSFTVAVGSSEKFKPEACAGPPVLSLQRTCEIVECTSKAEDSVGLRTASKEQTSVAGTVQTVTLACPAVAPAQALSASEDELKKSGFEILYSDRERPQSGWLTGRAGKHWVELVSGPDGDSISYALTSIALGEVVGAPSREAPVVEGSGAQIASSEPAPVQVAPAVPVPDPAAPVVASIAPPQPEPHPAAEPVRTENPAPAAMPTPAPTMPKTPAATPAFTPPRAIAEVPIQSTHDLIWSVSGNIVVNMLVDVGEDGSVTNATLTGRITKGVLKLEAAARVALSHWRFEPARQDGRTVAASKIPIQLHFQGRPWQY